MISIEKVDLSSKKAVNEFVEFPFKIYRNIPQWVPPILSDIKLMLNPKKHPFYCPYERRDGRPDRRAREQTL